MKANELKINGKIVQFEAGLGLVHLLAEELKTDSLGPVINYFTDMEGGDGIKLDAIPKLAKLVRLAVLCGSKEDFSEKTLEGWVYANMKSTRKVLDAFWKNAPGQGESDQELGNQNAP